MHRQSGMTFPTVTGIGRIADSLGYRPRAGPGFVGGWADCAAVWAGLSGDDRSDLRIIPGAEHGLMTNAAAADTQRIILEFLARGLKGLRNGAKEAAKPAMPLATRSPSEPSAMIREVALHVGGDLIRALQQDAGCLAGAGGGAHHCFRTATKSASSNWPRMPVGDHRVRRRPGRAPV